MSIIVDRFNKIKSYINNEDITIIAVSKTFSFDYIAPLIEAGHLHFGENKVQEAESKWKKLKSEPNKIKLNLLGNFNPINQKKL